MCAKERTLLDLACLLRLFLALVLAFWLAVLAPLRSGALVARGFQVFRVIAGVGCVGLAFGHGQSLRNHANSKLDAFLTIFDNSRSSQAYDVAQLNLR